MERSIEKSLGQAGDFAGAAAWRRSWGALGTGIRIAIAGTDATLVHRLARGLPADAHAVVMVVDPAEPEAAVDLLLGAHGIVWATPATAPLAATERSVLTHLADAAPIDRVVVLADIAALGKMSDDPQAELTAVHERLDAHLDQGWTRCDDMIAWAQVLTTDARTRTRERRQAVARLLLDGARLHTDLVLTDLHATLDAKTMALEQAQSNAEEAHTRASRTAAHVLGAVHRNTDKLLIDWSAFLYELEDSLAKEMHQVADVAVLQHALPKWLAHVVEEWVEQRMHAWEVSVREDVAELQLDDGWLRAAALVAPAMHPGPVRARGGWKHRLAVTGALAGGAAMLAFRLWLPGVAALAGGLLLGGIPRPGREEATREDLLVAAQRALRALGAEAKRLIDEQQLAIEHRLQALAAQCVTPTDDITVELAADLQTARAAVHAREGEIQDARAALDDCLAALAEAG